MKLYHVSFHPPSIAVIYSYELDGPKFEPQIFPTRPDRPEAHPATCKTGTGSISREQSSGGMALTTHVHLTPRSKKEYSTILLDLHGLLYRVSFILFYFTILEAYIERSTQLTSRLSNSFEFLRAHTNIYRKKIKFHLLFP
jgi:hypothetical protein